MGEKEHLYLHVHFKNIINHLLKEQYLYQSYMKYILSYLLCGTKRKEEKIKRGGKRRERGGKIGLDRKKREREEERRRKRNM